MAKNPTTWTGSLDEVRAGLRSITEPPRKEHKTSVRDLVEQVADEIRRLRGLGYSRAEIAKMLRDLGVSYSPQTLMAALSNIGTRRTGRRAALGQSGRRRARSTQPPSPPARDPATSSPGPVRTKRRSGTTDVEEL